MRPTECLGLSGQQQEEDGVCRAVDVQGAGISEGGATGGIYRSHVTATRNPMSL